MLFPLKFSPFELYYWSDDGPEYPTTYPVDLLFSGNLNREAFGRALDETLARHPLMTAAVDDSGPIPRWFASGWSVTIDWADGSAPVTAPGGEYIDLRREPGVRVWVRAGDDSTRVLMQFHHACADGGGLTQFLEDLFVHYRSAVTGETPTLTPLDPERLSERGAIDIDHPYHPSLVEAIRDLWTTACVWLEILRAKPALLAAAPRPASGETPSHVAAAPRTLPEFEAAALTGAEVLQLRAAAKSRGASLNDLLLADLLVVVAHWNHRQIGAPRRPLRINVPVNIRGQRDAGMPAANRIGFAFVTADERELGDRRTLLDAVHQQTQRIKEWKLALFFLGGLEFAMAFPRLIRWALGRNRSFATIVHSNLGRVFTDTPLPRRDGRLDCGDVVLERFTSVPPIRRLTRAAIAVLQYGDDTTICLRCDPRYFRPEQTRELLEAYVAQLRQTAGQVATATAG